jgi:hypothetical protein
MCRLIRETARHGFQLIGSNKGTMATDMHVAINASGSNSVCNMDPSVQISAVRAIRAIARGCRMKQQRSPEATTFNGLASECEFQPMAMIPYGRLSSMFR